MGQITPELAIRGSRTRRRQYRFGIHDIAKAAGKSIDATRKDRQRGKYNPHDLSSLTQYIHAQALPKETVR